MYRALASRPPVVYVYTMLVRKQFHIDEKQDRALKKRAKQLGISETEIVRRAIALVLLRGTDLPPPDQDEAANALIESMSLAARKHKLPRSFQFDRGSLHDERTDELLRRLGT